MSYVYTVARLRGLENKLLDAGFFSRLIDSQTTDDALKALGETSYSQWLSQGEGFDKAIDAEMLATCRELAQFVPDKELLIIFRMPYDFHNVKVLLKGLFKVRGGDAEGRRYDLLSPLGAFNVDELTEAIETEEYGHLPYGLADVIPECWALWDASKNPQAVELLLDHQMFRAMLDLAKKLNQPEVVKWVKSKIDAENLRSAIRLARMKYDAAKGVGFFHDGGNIRPADMAKLLNEPLETWSKVLSYTDFAGLLENLQDNGDVNLALSDASKALDKYLIKALEATRFKTDAPASVLFYLLKKEAETRSVRTALVSVDGGLNRDFARRLLA